MLADLIVVILLVLACIGAYLLKKIILLPVAGTVPHAPATPVKRKKRKLEKKLKIII